MAGAEALISRTGYTGEDGFELYLGVDAAEGVWKALAERGEGDGVIPAGLGARDSLRLEMGYALYGNDLDEEHTALESGLGWIVKLECGDFVGREALARQKEEGVAVRLTGIRLTERGFPRSGYPVVAGGENVGHVTSGVLSPSLGEGGRTGLCAGGAGQGRHRGRDPHPERRGAGRDTASALLYPGIGSALMSVRAWTGDGQGGLQGREPPHG